MHINYVKNYIYLIIQLVKDLKGHIVSCLAPVNERATPMYIFFETSKTNLTRRNQLMIVNTY